ncbi:MAG TPA: hypothetical protein VKQ30_02700 [Ktedonobacterales bacterium]|nr:hypothetical protein [Ktedonobacterales bacterium]
MVIQELKTVYCIVADYQANDIEEGNWRALTTHRGGTISTPIQTALPFSEHPPAIADGQLLVAVTLPASILRDCHSGQSAVLGQGYQVPYHTLEQYAAAKVVEPPPDRQNP